MGEMLVFPLARRRDLVLRQSAWFSERSHEAAEANLRRQVAVQADALRRLGVAPYKIATECQALEAAIRAEVWRVTRMPGGVA